LLTDAERYHGLYIEDILDGTARSHVEIGVILERHTDKVAHRILGQLRQLLAVELFCPSAAANREDRQRRHQAPSPDVWPPSRWIAARVVGSERHGGLVEAEQAPVAALSRASDA
jgi:hypothetical protein